MGLNSDTSSPFPMQSDRPHNCPAHILPAHAPPFIADTGIITTTHLAWRWEWKIDVMEQNRDPHFADNSEKDRGPEHRMARRFACEGFAEVVVPYLGFLFRGEITDLSESGCYIRTRARLNVSRSAEVELRFTVNGDHFSLLARIASATSGVGAGFEFSVIDPTVHRSLLRLIEELSAAESAL